MRQVRITLLALGASALVALSANTNYATQYSLVGSVEQNYPFNGVQTYDLYLSLSKWLTSSNINENKLLEVTAPNGMQFQEIAGGIDWVQMIFRGSSLADFNSSFVGDWRFKETLGPVTKEYSFTLPAIPSAVFLREAPIITSPLDGATVGKVFDMKWENPDGNSFGYRASQNPQPSQPFYRPSVSIVNPGHAVLSFADFPDFQRTEYRNFSISVEAAETRFQLTPISQSADATLTSLNFLQWEVRSPEIGFTVIPEPSSFLSLSLAVMCAAGSRGFVRGDG